MRQTDLPRPTGPNVMQLDAILDVANSEDIGDSDFDIEEMEMEMEMRSVFSASLRSSIWDHEYEGGRRVSSFFIHVFVFPQVKINIHDNFRMNASL